jgi:uncharacterized protein YqhQ
MIVKVAENGDFIFAFRADEIGLGLQILESVEPKDEEAERAIQHSIDMLMRHNNQHQWATLN